MRGCWLIVLAVGCAAEPYVDDLGDTAWADGKEDGSSPVNIAATHLDIHLQDHTGTATIELEKNGNLELEAGGLDISHVKDARGNRHFTITAGKLRVANVRGPIEIDYSFKVQDNADGLLAGGSTVIWPYFCGNLFPCHSQPADGEQFSLALDGIPSGQTAVYPTKIDSDAPPYMIAFAVGNYASQDLGATTAGTHVSVHWLPNGKTAALAGTKHLRAAFDWYEQNIGPYSFGNDVASVSVVWGEGMYGGMEHHPYWHVASDAMSDEETHVHEAAHGWFGDGIRLRCWEDFVLSEGTVSYLAAHVLGKVAGADAETAVWNEYRSELESAIADGGAPAWPTGCNKIDILKDNLFTNIPYMEGAYFYKDVAAKIGADKLDQILHDFYMAHRGQPAGMQDMIDLITSESGYDPSQLVTDRLRKQF
ncbi:MAG: M1 family aminopeptidase [Kofleriaceae bacterium]